MAWETRGNNRYYYRKKKVGCKVVSEYVGKGPVAQELASMDLVERQERNRELGVIRKERYELGLLDRQVMQSILVMDRMVEVFLRMLGFHKHKGQWRKVRNGKN
jgi:adenylosuccinate synthase